MKKILTLITALLIASSVNYSQGISLGASGGLSTITGPDIYTNDVSEGGFGFSSAPHFGVKGKFSLPLIPLRITGQVLYSQFTGEGDVAVGNSSVVASLENKLSVLIYGVGAEYSFVPGPISPYLAFDLFMTNYGDFEQTYTTASSNVNTTTEGESRTGIGLGAGLEFGLLPMIDIDLSAKYNINNLIGKNDGEDTFSTLNVSATVFLGL